MMHPDIMRLMADERLATLRHDARRPAPRPARSTPAVDLSEIDLRLCKASDDAELEYLAALSEQPLAPGRFVVAIVNGRIAAALPLAGGRHARRSVRADGAPAAAARAARGTAPSAGATPLARSRATSA